MRCAGVVQRMAEVEPWMDDGYRNPRSRLNEGELEPSEGSIADGCSRME